MLVCIYLFLHSEVLRPIEKGFVILRIDLCLWSVYKWRRKGERI